MAQINYGLLDTGLPERLGAMPANALAQRRQRIMQDEQFAQQREQAQMQNALARMQMQKAQGEMDEESAYKAALGGVQGGDYAGSMPQLMQASPARAMSLQKNLTEQQKAIIDMRSKTTDTQAKTIGMYRDQLTGLETPEQMAQWYISQRRDPALSGYSWPTTIDDTLMQLRNASQSPQGFEQFKQKVGLGMKDFLAANKPSEFERTAQMAGLSPEQMQAAARARITKETTHAPGTSVSVTTGQKGFENELKVRGDFRSEPVYKAHQEMTSAYGQIRQALGQASPAGDLAGATKLMKLLDPGSVVRESELGMAMAASGLLDRVQNYATNVLNGTKLTPTQRKDFQSLADALYQESVKGYNTKAEEYRGIARDYGFNEGRIVGSLAAVPTSATSKRYVETRRTADGRTLGKLPDGTVEVVQ